MDCSKHTGVIKCAHYYCAICKHCNRIICHTCLLEEELFELDLIYGDDCDYEAYNYFISDNEHDDGNEDDSFSGSLMSESVGNEMPPLEPWTPTKK